MTAALFLALGLALGYAICAHNMQRNQRLDGQCAQETRDELVCGAAADAVDEDAQEYVL